MSDENKELAEILEYMKPMSEAQQLWRHVYVGAILERELQPDRAAKLADDTVEVYNLRWTEGSAH